MIFLTDLHLDCFKQFSTQENGINTRLLDQIKAIAEVEKAIERSDSGYAIFLGDLINSFSDSLPKVVYNAIWYAISTWSQYVQLYIIAGNHDIYRQMHIFDPYRHMKNVHIVTEPIQETIEGYKVDMLPWGYDIPNRTIFGGDILAAHLEVNGAIMNAAGIRTHDGTTVDKMASYKYVFLGHYHEAQMLAVPGATWAGYIGSIMQTDLGLSPTGKGITHFNNGEVRFEEIASPKIYTAQIDKDTEVPTLEASIAAGNYWRVTVTDPAIRLPAFDHRVQVEYDIKPKMEARLEEKAGEDLKETVLRFIDMVDTKVRKDLAKELVKAVMQ